MNTLPNLDAPGAGLPGPELMIARFLFGRHCKRHSPKDCAEILDAEGMLMREIADSVDADAAGRQVLIKRLRGLEDSSRFWSLRMVLHHVHIVNSGIAETIDLLADGRTPERESSTAAVKPDPGIGPEVVDLFDRSRTDLLNAAEKNPDLRAETRYAHPWFGPLNAFQWFALAAFHLRLHRRQMQAIAAGL